MKVKRFLILLAIFGLAVAAAVFIAAGCQSSGGGAVKTLSNAEAQNYAQMGNGLSSDITGAVLDWAQNGAITGLSALGVVQGSSIRAATSTVTEEGDGWFRITESTTEGGTMIVDLHAKLDKNSSDEVIGVSLYGAQALTFNTSSEVMVYEMIYGNGSSEAYYNTIVRNESGSIESMIIQGSVYQIISMLSTLGNFVVSMNRTYNLTIPVTEGVTGYPTGTIAINHVGFNEIPQPDITMNFDGDNTGTISYGSDYTAIFTIEAN
jgi:hypothetical protein